MDSTRVSHSLGDPKIRQVGFFVPESSTTDSHKILSPSHLSVPEMQNSSVHGQVTSRSYDYSENRNLETDIGTHGILIYCFIVQCHCCYAYMINELYLFFLSCIRKEGRGRERGYKIKVKATERKNYQSGETSLARSTESC